MRTSLAPQGVGLGPGPPAVYVSLRGFCLSLFFIGKILVYFVLCRPIGGSSFRPSSGYCLVTYFRPPAHETMPHPPLSSLLCVHDANQPRFDSGFTLRCNWICCNNPSPRGAGGIVFIALLHREDPRILRSVQAYRRLFFPPLFGILFGHLF